MKDLFAWLTLGVVTACSSPPAAQESQSTIESPLDTAFTMTESLSKPPDSVIYIGYVGKFDDRIFYTDLYFVDDFDHADYDKIKMMGDKVMYEGVDLKRTRIPLEKGGKYFVLEGLSQISIYNRNNKKVANGTFSHIELVEDMIEDQFVAAFEVDNPLASDYLFCVGYRELEPLTNSEFYDAQLTSDVRQLLNLDSSSVWQFNSYRIEGSGESYTIISADTTGYIVEAIHGEFKTVYKSKYNEAISSLAILSRKINGKPVLLMRTGMPETDITWTSLLVWNGKEYEPMERSRIKPDNW